MGLLSKKILLSSALIFKLSTFQGLSALMFVSTAHAAIVVNSVRVQGGSAQRQITDNQWRVYGSFTGPIPPGATTNEVDSCTVEQNTFVGCNRKRLTENSILTVTFSDDAQFQGLKSTVAYIKITENFTQNPINIAVDDQPRPQTGLYQARIEWSRLCTELGGSMQNYATASTAAGTPIISCIDAATGLPVQAETQLAVGLASDNITPALNEVIINLRIFTPDFEYGEFNPNMLAAADIIGTDDFENKTPCTEANGENSGVTRATAADPTKNYSGFCDFHITPGDEKLFMVRDPGITNSIGSYSGNFESELSGVRFSGYVLYLSNENFDATLPWDNQGSVINQYRIIGDPNGGYEQNSLTGRAIRNDRPVFARMATLDEAGNITHLFSQTVIDSVCGAIPTAPADLSDPADPNFFNYYRFFVGHTPDPAEATPYVGRCPYATIPSLVTGLLSEDINCFVATALKGSPYDYQVLALREFRNRFLKSSNMGRAFIDYYYKRGPKAAQWLNDNPEYKPVFRVLLWPAYITAYIFNAFGAFVGLVFLIFLLAAPLALFSLRKRAIAN